MPESETVIVFRVLGVLAETRNNQHPLGLEDIASAVHLDNLHAQRVITVLELAGAVRMHELPAGPPSYLLTRYGRERRGCTSGHSIGTPSCPGNAHSSRLTFR